MQRYRFDREGEATPGGSIPIYAEWMGGLTLSGVRNCRVNGTDLRRVVYVTGEPDTWFSIPAACWIKGKRIKGWLGMDAGEYAFHPYKAKD